MRIISQTSGRGTGQRGLATAGVASIEPSCRFWTPAILNPIIDPFVILELKATCKNNFKFTTQCNFNIPMYVISIIYLCVKYNSEFCEANYFTCSPCVPLFISLLALFVKWWIISREGVFTIHLTLSKWPPPDVNICRKFSQAAILVSWAALCDDWTGKNVRYFESHGNKWTIKSLKQITSTTVERQQRIHWCNPSHTIYYQLSSGNAKVPTRRTLNMNKTSSAAASKC